jgi:hypothetical protein
MIQRKNQYVYCYEFINEYALGKGMGKLFNTPNEIESTIKSEKKSNDENDQE